LNWEVDLSKHVVTGAPCGGALGAFALYRTQIIFILL
jgi:hypothetical protein